MTSVMKKPHIRKTDFRMKMKRFTKDVIRDRWVYFLLLPGMIYFLIFKYMPMGGLIIAFQDYVPALGFSESKWAGMKHFERLFSDPVFYRLLRNTLILSALNLFVAYPLTIILAIMLNEVRQKVFKKTVQTLVYIPHFMSWVIVVSMFYVVFETKGSFFQELLNAFGLPSFSFMLEKDLFHIMYLIQVIFRDTGWGTVIFLAALASINPELLEAARMDGANRMRQIWHVTVPGIRPVIIILFILKLSDILDLGFEHIFLLLNPLNREIADIFDTYVYRTGLIQGQFSYSTAVGMFKGVVGLILVVFANRMAKKLGEEGIW